MRPSSGISEMQVNKDESIKATIERNMQDKRKKKKRGQESDEIKGFERGMRRRKKGFVLLPYRQLNTVNPGTQRVPRSACPYAGAQKVPDKQGAAVLPRFPFSGPLSQGVSKNSRIHRRRSSSAAGRP